MISKREAVRQAIRELGMRANSQAIADRAADILVDDKENEIISYLHEETLESAQRGQAAFERYLNWFAGDTNYDHPIWQRDAAACDVSRDYAVFIRKEMQKEHGYNYDLRTYRDQPGRDMREPILN
jgi:hypothetical protein